jgi:DNA repair protein RecN (Recombination protein N)
MTIEFFSKLKTLAEKISAKRKKQIKPFEDAVNKLLHRIGMPNAKIRVDIRDVDPGLYGIDGLEFLFNANTTGKSSEKDLSFLPLRKVASGGELSRLMLSIKSLVATSVDLPSMIFDEIDSGISGEAARQVGIIMKELAAQRQVICITHQPQIAGKGDAHFFVYKEIINDQVKTNIRRLTVEERITAIAKMLSGEKPTAAAMENAREMIMN